MVILKRMIKCIWLQNMRQIRIWPSIYFKKEECLKVELECNDLNKKD